MKKIDDKEPYSFLLSIPATATSYLLCWKIEGCENGVVKDNNRNVTKAIYLFKSGVLPL